MAYLNKCMFIGNLGRDPEVRMTANGNKVTTFSMAVTKHYKSKDGQKREATEWIRVVAWKGLAEVAGNYLKKGSPVYIEGEMKTRQWDDKDGNKRYTTEINADQLQLLGSGKSNGASPSENPGDPQENLGLGESMGPSEEDLPF